MKQLIFTIATILTFTTGLKSQNYVPFPSENVNWNVYFVGTCEEKAPDTTLLRYTIHGDITINEVVYKKLCLERGDTINPIVEAIGGIREKDKKIYYNGRTILSSTGGKEYLLYDFTKQIGDTIKHNPQGWFYSVILEIDSIMIDGTYRKRYEVDNHWFYKNPDYIIEGIGSVKNGLLGHISDIPTCGYHYWEFICFRENGEVKYLNPSFNDCFPVNLLMGANLTKMVTQIKIYPNPVTDEIQIENNTNKNLLLKIIDLNGRLILEQQLNGIKTLIKLNGRPGIYTILITNEIGQIMLNQKIIKQ
jgi:hypothetical protein